MIQRERRRALRILGWIAVCLVAAIPVLVAAASPLQASRDPVWIIGGMAGIVALSLLLIQPILVSAYGAGIGAIRARRWHRLIGLAVVVAVAIHVVGLYLYSPDDITDALLLVAPTPFGVYGVIAMWCLGLTAILAVARSRLRIASGTWRLVHSMLSAVVVVTGVIHALLIDGTMGSASKLVLCVSLLVATTVVLVHLNLVQPYRARRRTRRSPSG